MQRLRKSDIPEEDRISIVSFPDDGAAKRFGGFFKESEGEWKIVVCGKTRGEGGTRKVVIQDGANELPGRNVIIVDDLCQTGGTLFECGRALRQAGASSVSAYVTHAVFPKQSWKRFAGGGDRSCFKAFFVTDSIPTSVAEFPKTGDDVFEVLPLFRLLVHDLDHYTTPHTSQYPDLGV